jgi:DNA-binding CsgD family transcriptional regulator
VDAGPLASLRPAEQAVWSYIGTRLTVKEIAEQMHLSADTVKTHLSSIYRKLGLASRRDAQQLYDDLAAGGRPTSPAAGSGRRLVAGELGGARAAATQPGVAVGLDAERSVGPGDGDGGEGAPATVDDGATTDDAPASPPAARWVATLRTVANSRRKTAGR